jgi:hypothetical protein
MTSVAAPDVWREKCLISITERALGSASSADTREFGGIVETVDIDLAEKGIDVVALVNGGRVVKFTPMAETTIKFEAYPTDALGSTSLIQQFLGNTEDVAQPLVAVLNLARKLYRVAITWTDDAAMTSAEAITLSDKRALRFVAADCYLTSAKRSFTDYNLKFTFEFKCAPFDKAGTANIKEESTDGSAVIPALSHYNETQKWV